MNLTLIAGVRIIAVVFAGMLAGIFFGSRVGLERAMQTLDPSHFVKFQQGVHLRFVRFMPPFNGLALLAGGAWAWMLRSRPDPLASWLVTIATCGVALNFALTLAVSVPINNRLMTWDAAAPPTNLREIWAPWDRVNTVRTLVSAIALVLEAIALSYGAA
jgi:uncharacterized membrane protein